MYGEKKKSYQHCLLSNKYNTFMVKKVKCTLVQALRLCTCRTAHRGSRGIALLIIDHGTRRGWGVNVTPRPLFTPGKDPVPIVQEDGLAQGRSGQVWKISPSLGFDSRTFQYVASRYTNWATRPTHIHGLHVFLKQKCLLWGPYSEFVTLIMLTYAQRMRSGFSYVQE
jgi:hypothetical protein